MAQKTELEKNRNAASVSGNRDTLPKQETSRSKQQMLCEARAFTSHLEALGVLSIVWSAGFSAHALSAVCFASHCLVTILNHHPGKVDFIMSYRSFFRHCGVSVGNSSSR